MMQSPPVLSLSALLVLVVAVLLLQLQGLTVEAKSKVSPLLQDWTAEARVRQGDGHRTAVYLLLTLPHGASELMHDTVVAVSDPESPRYGQYLSPEEIRELVGISQANRDAVEQWLLSDGGLDREDFSFGPTGDFVIVECAAWKVERAFGVPLFLYRSKFSSSWITLRSPREARIPEALEGIVTRIHGINELPPQASRPRRRASSLEKDEETLFDTRFNDQFNPSNTIAVEDLQQILQQQQQQQQGMHVQRRAATVSENASATITKVAGIPDGLVAYFAPLCTNGQVPQNPSDPCTLEGSTLTAVNLNASTSPLSPNYVEYEGTMLSVACSSNTSCSAAITVQNYLPVTYVAVQLVFADGSVTQWAEFTEFPAVANPVVSPRTLKDYYNIPQNTLITNKNATQAVGSFEQQYYEPSALRDFFNAMGLAEEYADLVTVHGPNKWGTAVGADGVEANLDTQYIMGTAPGADTAFWSVGANSTAEIDDIMTWAIRVINSGDPPLVNSLSYGMTEVNVDFYLGDGYMAETETYLKELALMGVTIVIADGDSGAGDLGGPPIAAPDCDTLHGDWPSNSPYVTAVSSTFFSPLSEPVCNYNTSDGGFDCLSQPLGEIVVGMTQGMRWTTGGGFSNFTARAWYQEYAVEQYLERTDNLSSIPSWAFNVSGRAYPDVSAVGHNLWVANNGTFFTVDGTSASAPIFAGIVTLLNQARLNAGMPQLGFLNPLFYRIWRTNPDAFFDVTYGSNKCGAYGTEPTCCEWGFDGIPGFDAATGLGTPNYGVLLAEVLGVNASSTKNMAAAADDFDGDDDFDDDKGNPRDDDDDDDDDSGVSTGTVVGIAFGISAAVVAVVAIGLKVFFSNREKESQPEYSSMH